MQKQVVSNFSSLIRYPSNNGVGIALSSLKPLKRSKKFVVLELYQAPTKPCRPSQIIKSNKFVQSLLRVLNDDYINPFAPEIFDLEQLIIEFWYATQSFLCQFCQFQPLANRHIKSLEKLDCSVMMQFNFMHRQEELKSLCSTNRQRKD